MVFDNNRLKEVTKIYKEMLYSGILLIASQHLFCSGKWEAFFVFLLIVWRDDFDTMVLKTAVMWLLHNGIRRYQYRYVIYFIDSQA